MGGCWSSEASRDAVPAHRQPVAKAKTLEEDDAEAVDEAGLMFAKISKKGIITLDRLHGVVWEALGKDNVLEEDFEELVHTVDKDDGGTIDEQEFRVLYSILQDLKDDGSWLSEVRASFQKADVDGDHALTFEELKDLCVIHLGPDGWTEEELRQMFAAADVDGEANLSLAEFVPIFSAMRRKLPQHRKLDPAVQECIDLFDGTMLELRGFDLTEIPEEVYALTSMKILKLPFNKITHVSERIGELTNLETLRLNSNQLESVHPAVGTLVKLTMVDLHDNKLSSIPAEVLELPNLKMLWVGNNNIREDAIPPREGVQIAW